jgi:excisionase family DNA binding protein
MSTKFPPIAPPRKPAASGASTLLPSTLAPLATDLHGTTRRRVQIRGTVTGSNDVDIHQLTVSQVGQICQVHPKTVYSWVKQKKLKAVRLDRLIRIDLKEPKSSCENSL